MKTLMVIGAGPSQVPAIRRARARGFNVIATDMNPGSEGFSLATAHAVISTRDVKGNIAYARSIRQATGLDGVMTLASESAITVAGVAEALGLPGCGSEAAWLASNKVARQQRFRERGVSSPRFARAHTAEEGVAEAVQIGWPVVVKPADSAGSRGVRKVTDASGMTDAVAEIRSHSRQPEFLVEEFLQGTEHSIEGVMIDGKTHWTAFSDRNYDKKEIYPPYFLEDGDTMPTALAPETLSRIRVEADRAVRALGIEWGPVKGDVLVSAAGPRILEMAARLSGDYFCNETTPLHNGVDLLDVIIDLSLGAEIDPDRLQPRFSRGVALRYLWPRPGRVRAIRNVDAVRNWPGVQFVNWEPRWRGIEPGTVITPAKSMGERVGCVLAHADSRREAVALAEKAVQQIRIETDSN